MARTKTRYRQFRDGGRVDQAELPTEPPIEQPTEAVSAPPEAPPAEAAPPQPEPPAPQAEQPQQDDTATNALKRQIESLRQSEQLQRQRAAMPQQPITREARLAAWAAEGISPAEVQFFQNHPAMVDYPQITGLAVHRAKEAGLERDTVPFFAFVEKSFDAQVEHLMQQQAAPAMPPTPAFFKVPPPRPAPNPSSLVSAPVSRSIPNASGARPRGQVKLSPSEVEAARISGLSVEDYARQKVEYERQRETGEYRDNREQR